VKFSGVAPLLAQLVRFGVHDWKPPPIGVKIPTSTRAVFNAREGEREIVAARTSPSVRICGIDAG